MKQTDYRSANRFEWQTLALVALSYFVWASALFWVAELSLGLAVVLVVLSLALHSSLQHEVLHGHPFRSEWASALLVFPAIGLFIPYLRFRDTHLEHHRDQNLTDPYDDPESNYLDPGVWETLPRWLQGVLALNNTLLGRMLIGPAVAQISFMATDWRAIRNGDRRVALGWVLHVPAVALVVPVVWLAPMPVWVYLLSAYLGLSILKIRTFLEHQAHERVRGRTVVIEDRGPLAFLFLNNNLHVVHHMHPKVPWYRLWALYDSNRARYLKRNEGYCFRSYGEVFRQYFLRAKDPVPHPLWRR